jgi:asparagine synthase (glutamine-hydrolysing)
MCGIAGILGRENDEPVHDGELRQMLAMIRHRGPDQFGIYCDGRAGLGSARLSIIDINNGQQPIANEDNTLWIVFNGEIFNYVELRPELEARGHQFSTQTDTEVILHLYEELGPDCVRRLNGQFAFAIWDSRNQSLFLARDRLGVRPLFYTQADGRLLFGSEIKALLSVSRVPAAIDPVALSQVFTFWSPLSPRTIFRDIIELPPGNYLIARNHALTVHQYWELDFPGAGDAVPNGAGARALEDLVEEFRALLVDAVRIRLRADVPVGAYLSGGLDSSTIASIIRSCATSRLDTFSIAFDDSAFDERSFQQEMARHLGTEHQVLRATHADIGRVFPDVIWHTETPIMRTSPAPMFLLSKLARDRGYKVVLTGEGADEFLAGYDIFKEARIRRFWAREPESTRRPRLFQRLYRDIPGFANGNGAFISAFFKENLSETGAPWYSHFIRWKNNRRTCRFFSAETAREISVRTPDYLDQVAVPSRFPTWGPLEQAQYLEIKIFLSEYLLSSQGDRVSMAHSVEGRYPFLDIRVVDFCNRLPANLKLRGLTEKFLLKQCARRWLPDSISQRPKRPYRAPIHKSFFHDSTPDYVQELCSHQGVRDAGLFEPAAVSQLVRRAAGGALIGETDDMALAGIISSQLLHSQFVKSFRRLPPLNGNDNLKICGPISTHGNS